MKTIKKALALHLIVMFMALTAFTPVTQAEDASASATTTKSTIKLSKKSVTLAVGKSYTLKTKGTSKKATWKTSKKSIAKITNKKAKSVKITAVKVGTSTITAKIGKKTYKCKVTVVNPKLSKSKLNLTVGDKSTLNVTGGTGKVTYKSADTSIATVSSKGVITAKKAGTVKITAKSNGKNLNCTVTIKAKPKATPVPTKKPTPTPKPVAPTKQNPTLSASTLHVQQGAKATLTVQNAGGTVKWTSNDKTIATVSSKGQVTGVRVGTTVITASVGSYTMRCVIIVSKPSSVVTPTPKPATPTPTPTPKPTNKPSGAISPTETDYGYQKLAKNAQGQFMYVGEPIYYYDKDDMPYEFRVGERLPNNVPDAPYLRRRWVTTDPNKFYQKRVSDKQQSEWECTCGIGWGFGYKTTNETDFDTHKKTCSWNTRINTIIINSHEEQTVGGYWGYYNDYTDTWY